MEAVRFDLRWKVALDLPLDHPSHGDVAERKSPCVARGGFRLSRESGMYRG
jgi:hypothetical protein